MASCDVLTRKLPNSRSPRRSSLIKSQASPTFAPNQTAVPYYANNTFDLYYSKTYPKNGNTLGGARNVPPNCPITGDALDHIMNLDLTPVLNNIDVRKNEVLRTIKRLDEKLNSPVCRFLEAYQPDLPCSCEEACRPDAECPCPPAKEPLKFDLYERKLPFGSDRNGTRIESNISDETKRSLHQKAGSFPSGSYASKRDEIENQVQALDEKLRSPEFHFLKPLEPEQIARCSCERTNFPQAHCACPPKREPIDFQNKVEVQKNIKALDSLLNSSEFGLSGGGQSEASPCSCENSARSSGKKPILKGISGGRGLKTCLSNCPSPRCRCGGDCPAKPGPFQKFPSRTFHVPGCPSDRGRMLQPRSPIQGAMACPFSPACCPISEVCPFPVATVYDPKAPPLPPSSGPRRCPLVPTTLPTSNEGDPSRPPCPLDPLKPPRGPPSCPLTSKAGCPLGQKSECPLLTCSLGPLKSIIFDGNEECPFCHSKCCPMISPDGPGCPISINATFCPLGKTDACGLKGMSSPPPFQSAAGVSISGPKNDEESCPIGELLEANANMAGCRCGAQKNPCPLTPPKPCPASSLQSSCSCALSTAPNILDNKSMRPGSCPLGGLKIPQPPAPPCPLSMNAAQRNQCPMTNLGDKNLDSSCPVSNIFQCPALKGMKFSLAAAKSNKKVPESETADFEPNIQKTDEIREHLPKEFSSPEKINSSDKIQKQQRVESPPKPLKKGSTQKNKNTKASTHVKSEVVRKTDKEMTKTFSRISSSTYTKSTSSTEKIFEVSLEPLPKPPLSETRLVKSSKFEMSRQFSPKREDVKMVMTSAPSDSKGFESRKGKQKPKNCPIPDPEPCPLEVPKCPFGPPEPACPLAKVPNCPLGANQGCCMTGMMLSPNKLECPAETPKCDMFPEGHCPMENLNMCECNYPIAPCLEPLIPLEDAQADDQYCSRLNCCMGLPLPPTKPSEELQTDTWYAYTDVKPGNPLTKHYLEILDVPPEPEFFVSINPLRKHPAWKILKYGEGYKECKRIKEILNARGPTSTIGTQFMEDDFPDDKELEVIEQLRLCAVKTMEEAQLLRSHSKEWSY